MEGMNTFVAGGLAAVIMDTAASYDGDITVIANEKVIVYQVVQTSLA